MSTLPRPRLDSMVKPQVADWQVPPLIGRLPQQCQRDVAELRRVVHAAVSQETPAAPVLPSEFREVLLTGATGFVGRFFLRELLRQNDQLIVHCLVRADSVQHGLQRLRAVMEETEIWEEDFAARLIVVIGDNCEERFGLGKSEFSDLCERIDAVYHLAANVGLVLSYADLREVNALGLGPVLELCLRTRYKHLFYVSTLGIFPAYYCNFAREYSQSRIDEQMSPDITDMKKVFPLGVVGYPWSKLVAEQGVLFAQAAGVPIAIFRLPLMGLPSTGYMHANDFPTRLFAAATQLEMAPRGFSIQRQTEPVDTVVEVCTAISLNPDRQFTVYHCCDPEPPYENLEVSEFGFYWKEVSYQSFRRSCQALGEDSPLHGHWALFDHFAPYWFSKDKTRGRLPISDRAIREDCPRPIKWPALLVRHARSYDWLRRNEHKWPHSVPKSRLDFDALVTQAETYARRMGVPFEETYPAWKLEGLKQLIESLKSPDAGLRRTSISHVIYGLTRALRNNAMLAWEREQHPEIEHQVIERPVFVAGINRTGTTFLHRLLSRDPQFWSLRRYELTEPVLSTGEYDTVAWTAKDPRRVYAEEVLTASGAIDALAGLHRLDMSEPEEDFMLLWLAFRTWAFTTAHYVPAYARWLAAAGSREVYAHHRYVMQNFAWQHRQREPKRQRYWLLKAPFHLRELEALLEVYPDAVFIQTHRDPVQVMASWNSLVERLRGFSTEPRPPLETGAEQLEFMSGMLNYAMRFRASNPALEERWIDVRYTDLIDDPMAVVGDIYAQFGWPLEPPVVDKMQQWLTLQEEQRRQEPRHEYRLEDYGLTPEGVNEAFAPYCEMNLI